VACFAMYFTTPIATVASRILPQRLEAGESSLFDVVNERVLFIGGRGRALSEPDFESKSDDAFDETLL